MSSEEGPSSAAAAPVVRPSRSVLDYATEDALRKALLAVELNESGFGSCGTNHQRVPSLIGGTSSSSAGGASCAAYAATTPGDGVEIAPEDDAPPSVNLDWVLNDYDPATTEAQSMKEELKRLQVLKSYLLLDSEREEAFERITAVATRVYNVPIALVSLLDLGRQWFMSNHGLGDVRETPRKLAFCAHAILSRSNKLIVPDATKDYRFKDNPLVVGPPDIRFYAGMPLMSPEGYKLGTFCIIDRKPWPEGLTEDQESTLRDLAAMTVDALVQRRHRLQTQENPAHLIAYTAHDLMQPLTGVQLSLSLLKDDEEFRRKIDGQQHELLSTATTCADLMVRICETAIDSLRRGSSEATATNDDLLPSPDRDTLPVTKMEELLRSLHMIVEPIPKQVPLIIKLDPSVPSVILCDDLKLFRSALNLLSSAASRCKHGYILFFIYPTSDNTELVFECTDTAENIPVEEYQYLYQHCQPGDGNIRLCLSSVASLISSLDGTYGFRPRPVAGGKRQTGSIFWFSVPLVSPDRLGVGPNLTCNIPNDLTALQSRRGRNQRPFLRKDPILPVINRISSTSTMSVSSARVPLMVCDRRQADVVQNSCFGSVFKTSIRGSNEDSIPGLSLFSTVPEEVSMPVGQPAVEDHQRAGPSAIRSSTRSPIPSQGRSHRTPRALVIDDSLVVRKSLAMALRRLGYEASQAENGLEGLQKLTEAMYDLVLCDFLMPVMDGFDCVKQFRLWESDNRPSFRQLIVGISAHANNSIATQGLDAGMDDFRPKPIGIKILTELHDSEAVRQSSRLLDDLEGTSQQSHNATHTVMDSEIESSRKRAAGRASVGMDCSEQILSHPAAKRQCVELSHHKAVQDVSKVSKEYICLIATDRPTRTSSDVLRQMESYGWKVVVVHDGTDALRLLQMRNWDAVLIDDDLPMLDGTNCMNQFRAWEHDNRVNRQKNTFYVSDMEIPSPFDTASIVQPPSGYDFVLHKPVVWKDLKHLLDRSLQDSSLAIVIKTNK